VGRCGLATEHAHSTILRVNEAFTRITGYSAQEIVGKTPRVLGSGRQDVAFYAALWKSPADTGNWKGEIWNRRKSGEVYPEELSITGVKDAQGRVTHYVATFGDISLNKAAQRGIRNLAFYDPLTQLPNRRLLPDRQRSALATSARTGKQGGLLFLDLDQFKTLNDTLGHDMGDLLLQQVALRLLGCVREGDTVARLGGDEWVMLEDLSDQSLEAAAQTKDTAEKILFVLDPPYVLVNHDYHGTSSVGANIFDGHRQAVDELLKQADLALYYQVQVDGENRAVGLEALIRWLHPVRGLVPPNDFIALAEDNGLIVPMGLWVLNAACAQLQTWQHGAMTRELVVAVNVSARQFRQADFVAQVQRVPQAHGVKPQRLKLELTESMLLEDVEDTIATMNSLNALGVRFSLDDFGTGYSSLQYLKRLPLDQRKIDQLSCATWPWTATIRPLCAPPSRWRTA
jgi:diguanylate cyclase (GGDEF)-like protein/PAS domain S-box-containing protein